MSPPPRHQGFAWVALLSLVATAILAATTASAFPTNFDASADDVLAARAAVEPAALWERDDSDSKHGQHGGSSSGKYAQFKKPDYSKRGLDKLWALLEDARPVEKAHVTTVQPRPSQDDIAVPPSPSNLLGLSDASQWPVTDPAVNKARKYKLPKDFKYGVASAAFQVEGAAKADGKGPSQWDFCGHVTKGCIANNQTGDVTDNHYYKFKEDMARIVKMGVDSYSFSFAWSRILPFGNGPVNQPGLEHYDEVIDEAIDQGLEPVGTLYHWDFPLSLEFQYGSWRDERMVDDFVHYAATVLRRYGDRVRTWFTFNEPNNVCGPYLSGFPLNTTYDGELDGAQAYFHCARNLLRAHGKVYRLYEEMQRNGTLPKGQMSMKNDNSIALPHRPGNAEDIRAAKRHDAVLLGLWSDPVYSTGEWPAILRETIPTSILPDLTDEDRKLIRGTADFYAIDLYSVRVARATRAPGGLAACERNSSHPDWPQCVSSLPPDYQTISTDDTKVGGWPLGEQADAKAPWLYNSAGLVRNFLRQIKETWSGDMKIYLSEVGFAEPHENDKQYLEQIRLDSARTRYALDQLDEYVLAIHEDGANLGGVFFWSIMDNLEWNLGLNTRFGLQYVNYTSPGLDREYKQSFLRIRDYMKQNREQ
ncbi:uncharacterized protein PFL1_06098 [Pseudozyma flocculosa PF-1]|uniref:Related to beta-glucosidase n=2 Tax=Pseudozyma flocculosa TaxID=84751 RepID=A0A5C3F4U7_9BASI|nr:uncharacterized protein PFL1_06098 [Pseudozyma flocculosa PF-1]EPQ26450.1 hypothetical protein PFL1_06098 [Pseudozyma flocculosa PF-1]SPO38955.1 related to beta-glucosidase [Pseudozyma flocculosa]